MKQEIDRVNYRKKSSQTKSTIAGILSLICFVGIILWQPNPEFGNPADVVVNQDAHAYIYNHMGAENRWQLQETDIILPAGTQLTAVAQCSEYKWAVDDNEGNRFAIDKSKVSGDVSGLKAITPGYRHVYRGQTLDGRNIGDIIKESGNYIYADASTGEYYFSQIVLADGNKRYEGVLLTIDSNGNVTNTEPTSPARKNVYTLFPFFDRIISMNLFTKFIPFTQDADTDIDEGFSLKKIGSSLWGLVVSIVGFIALILGAAAVILLSIGITYGAGNLIFNTLGRFTKLKNSIITMLEYVYMIPCTYIVLLSVLFVYNDFWLIVLPIAIGLLAWMFQFVESHSVRDARCSKCLALNTLDVEEVRYITGYNVEAHSGKSMKVGEEEEIKTVRVVEDRLLETHTECCSCHHVVDSSSKYKHTGNWVKIDTVACPKCGRHTLRATSTVIESTAEYITETYTHHGKIKDKGISLKTLDRVYESNDRATTYGHWTGYVLYDNDVYCTECDYDHTTEYKFKPDSKSEKISEEKFKTGWKRKDSIFD